MAVFLSLFLGILIGGALFQDSALVEEQGHVITEMEQRFKDLQVNLGSLRKELDLSQEAWQAVRDKLLPGQLLDKTVLVIKPRSGEIQQSVLEVLQQAGADVRILPPDELGLLNPGGNLSVIIPVADHSLDYSAKQELTRLIQGGSQVVYLSKSLETSLIEDLPSGWQITNADTIFGEIALVLGLASGTEIMLGFGS